MSRNHHCAAKVIDKKTNKPRYCNNQLGTNEKYCVTHMKHPTLRENKAKNKIKRRGGVVVDPPAGTPPPLLPSLSAPPAVINSTVVANNATPNQQAPVDTPTIKVTSQDPLTNKEPARETSSDTKQYRQKCATDTQQKLNQFTSEAKASKVYSRYGLPGGAIVNLLDFLVDESIFAMQNPAAETKLSNDSESIKKLSPLVTAVHNTMVLIAREPKSKGDIVKTGKTDRSEFLQTIRADMQKFFIGILELLRNPREVFADPDLERHFRFVYLNDGKENSILKQSQLKKKLERIKSLPWYPTNDTKFDVIFNKLSVPLRQICSKKKTSVFQTFQTRQNKDCDLNGFHFACHLISHLLVAAHYAADKIVSGKTACVRQELHEQRIPLLMSCWLADVVFWEESNSCGILKSAFKNFDRKF